jgi:hypothetical protein
LSAPPTRVVATDLSFAAIAAFDADRDPIRVSTLNEAVVRGDVAPSPLKVESSEHLSIANATGTLQIDFPAEGGIETRFWGSSTSVEFGNAMDPRDASPSWLEYLYHSAGWRMLVGAFVAVFGAVLSLRQILNPR